MTEQATINANASTRLTGALTSDRNFRIDCSMPIFERRLLSRSRALFFSLGLASPADFESEAESVEQDAAERIGTAHDILNSSFTPHTATKRAHWKKGAIKKADETSASFNATERYAT